jgi:non-ribosomal peptide synthetase component F
MNTILELFSDQIKSNPFRKALQFKDRFLSYKELDDESSRIAGYLNSLGISAGNRVAISLERSEKVITHILGVLKAGAAYIFLDPMYPPERLNYMLNFSEPDILIAEHDNIRWMQNGDVKIVEPDEINFPADKFIPKEISASGLAYLMFTSGSTGKPKAVMITHSNLMAYLPSINTIKKLVHRIFACILHLSLFLLLYGNCLFLC